MKFALPKRRHGTTSPCIIREEEDVVALCSDLDFPALPPSRTASVDLDSSAIPGLSSKRSIAPSRQASLHQDDIISRRSTPTVPPGFEAHVANESRKGTPTVPPGLEGVKPTALPAYLDDEIDGPASAGAVGKPLSRSSSRASLRRQASSQQILPALPLRPGTPAARPATPARLASSDVRPDDVTPTKPSKGKGVADESGEMKVAEKSVAAEEAAKTEEKVDAVKGKDTKKATENEKPAPAKVDTTAKAETEKDAAVSAEASSKDVEPSRPRKTSVPSSMQPASKGLATVQTSDAKASPVTPSKPDSKKEDSKRNHPGKLDITAAINKQQESNAAAAAAAGKHAGAAETPSKATGKMPAALAQARPESPSVSSPLAKAPRTLRVVATPTPKTEVPPVQSASTPVLEKTVAGVSGAGRMPSRQPSVASMNIPGTPTSEHVSMSDNISMTSTSQSRANSPPPSKVGSAPVRTKTKNQLKKERQERAKQIEEEKIKAEVEKTGPAQPEEEVQEAIVSRQKKKKKEKEPKPPRQPKGVKEALKSESTTPTASRPASPGQSKAQTQAAEQMATAAATAQASRNGTPTSMGEKMGPVPPPHMTPSPHNQDPSPPPTPTLTASALLAELKATAPEIQKCIDSLFRTPTSSHFKPNQPITPKDLGNPAFWKQDFKINLTKDEVDALLTHSIPAVHYGGEDGRVWSRGMITSSGSHLRALTEELEQRFLELEDVLRGIGEEGTFRSGKPQNEVRFPGVDLEGLRRGFVEGLGGGGGQRGVSVMEQMVGEGGVGKKGAFLVDEAGRYVNEFVMPPATPPPTTTAGGSGGSGGVGGVRVGAGGVLQGSGGGEGSEGLGLQRASLEVVERQLVEARRAAEESEGVLRKVVKRNRRVLGL